MDNEKNLSIEIKQDVAKGTYSNLSIITHSKSEFVIDFVSRLPGMPKAQVTDRIIMTPENAKRFFLALQDKRFFLALQDSIGKYEANNGTINLGEPKATFHFGDFNNGNGTKS